MTFFTVKANPPVNIFRDGADVLQVRQVEVFKDSTGLLPFQTVLHQQFWPVEENVLNFGITETKIWIRFSLQNESDNAFLQLMVAQPIIDRVVFYESEGNGKWASVELGEHKKFSERPVNNPNYVFPIVLPKDSIKHIYLCVSSTDQIQFPLYVGSQENLMELEVNRSVFIGMYAGIVLIMIAYNLFLYFSVRDINYIYYILFIFFVGLTQLNFKGYAFKYLWPNWPWLAINSAYLVPLLSALSTAVFVWEFLMIKVYAPRLGKGVIVYSVSCICAAILGLLGFRALGVQLLQFMAFVGVIYLLYLANYIRRSGYRPAFYFLLAFVSFIFSIIIFVLTNFGIIHTNFFTGNVLEFGSVAQILLLSFALADRINTYRKEKEESQAEALRISRENARIVSEQNQRLELEVSKRTADLQLANTDLHNAFHELKQAQTQLVEAEKMASLGMLTAGIAHEINNPINFVTANVGPLKRDIDEILALLEAVEAIVLDDQASTAEKKARIHALKEDLDYDYLMEEIGFLLTGIEDGAIRTTEIVKSLRVFSRVDEDDIKLADLNQGIESTLVILNSTIKDRIIVEKQFGELPMIECYPGKLNQVFLNLLTNSIYSIREKFGEKEGGKITISSYYDKEEIVLRFKDNGLGISEDIQDKIFEPFFTTKDVGEGTGLGLSIVLQIIKKHYGSIGLLTNIGEGAEFVLRLPVLQSVMQTNVRNM
ncbi:7TM diverse intracellular signaling domain-containing protein [Olivibacter ginsenosidimutans]|uniref:histidine kinase n=2 Tax=Olivibacter ginsenosidimutans TaxID=1176537 RepID=A0ABP9AEE6_9SPHI